MVILTAFPVIFLVSVVIAEETKIFLQNKAEPKLLSEHKFLENQFPYHARIIYETEEFHQIRSGTILTYRYILTAAYFFVVEKKKITSITVNVGHDQWAQAFQIALGKVTPHKHFQEFPLQNDIAVMETSNLITFSDYVQPAKLPHFVTRSPSFIGRAAHSIKLQYTSSRTPIDLFKSLTIAEMKIVPEQNCEQFEGFDGEDCICVRSKDGIRMTEADEGSALVLAAPLKKQKTIIGILSEVPPWDHFLNSYNIYTRVSFYVPWIKEKAYL